MPLSLSIKTCRDDSLVVDPLQALLFWAFVSWRLVHSRLLPRVTEDHCLVLDHTGQHFAVGAPANRCAVVGHVSECKTGLVILIDVPNLDCIVD